MKTIIRKGFISLIVFAILVGIGGYFYLEHQFFRTTASRLNLSKPDGTIPFIWAEEDHGAWVEPYNAMLIPVQLEGFDQSFYMQFDLGAQHSVLYWNPIKSLKEQGLAFELYNEDGASYTSNFKLQTGDMEVSASAIKVINFGTAIDWASPRPQIIIGTLGADLLAQTMVGINFKQKALQFYTSEPKKLTKNRPMSPFMNKGRRYIFPVKIQEQTFNLLYDSGFSPFGLLTRKSHYEELTPEGIKGQAYNINSWGEAIPVHNKPSQELISIGGAVLPLNQVSYYDYNETLTSVAMRLSPIDGILGNKVFLNSVLLLNTNKATFMVLPAE